MKHKIHNLINFQSQKSPWRFKICFWNELKFIIFITQAFKWGNFWDGFSEKSHYREGFQESKLTRNRWIATKSIQNFIQLISILQNIYILNVWLKSIIFFSLFCSKLGNTKECFKYYIPSIEVHLFPISFFESLSIKWLLWKTISKLPHLKPLL